MFYRSSLLNNPPTTPIDMQSNIVVFPDDDMPVQSRGAYTFNLDNLDAINPFQGSSEMQNSPPKSSALSEFWTSEFVESDSTAAPVYAPQPEVPEVTDTALDETLPFVPSVENSLAESSANISSAEGTVIIKTDNIENSATDVESDVESDMTDPAPVSQQIRVLGDQPEAEDLARLPAGSYNLDLDDLDSLNPFQTGGSKIPNSPLICKGSVVSDPPLKSQEARLEPELSVHTPDVPTSSDLSIPPQENSTATEGSSSTAPPKENQMLLEFNFDDGSEVKRKPPPKRLGVKRPAGAKPVTKKTVAPATEMKEPVPKQLSPTNPEGTEPVDVSVENSSAVCSANISPAEGTVIMTEFIENHATDVEESDMTEPAPVSQQIPVLEDQPEAQDSARPPVGSYNLVFDDLDSLNPFQTGGTKIPNSPIIGKASVVYDPPMLCQEAKQEPELSVHTPDVPTSSDLSMPPQENSTATEGSSSTAPPKENQMLLEFNFDDGAEVKLKPPPKRLGVKRPAGAKPVTKKPVAPATEKGETEPKQLSPKNPEETEPVDVPPTKGSYTFNIDKFDDPNFNPFGTKATMGNSPPRGVQTSPVLMKALAPIQEPEAFSQVDQPEALAQDYHPEHRYRN